MTLHAEAEVAAGLQLMSLLTCTMTKEETPRPDITKAVARGDLASVRNIVDAAAAISFDAKIKTLNCTRIWNEQHPAYQAEDNRASIAEWFDVTPITTAAMRGHHEIVEYLLAVGADPTLKGCPYDDVEIPRDDGQPLFNIPELHMNAFEAASKLSRKIRRCRRTQDLLMVVKSYWKRSIYSGSSAARHKRTTFSNLPLNLGWIVDGLKQVPQIEAYPLKPNDFNADMIDANIWKEKRKRESDIIFSQSQAQKQKVQVLPAPQIQQQLLQAQFVGSGSGRQRRCFSCGELKPEHSYNKNEKKKGVEARCLSCFASNPHCQIICPICKKQKLDDNGSMAICQPCMSRMASASKKPQPVAVKAEPSISSVTSSSKLK